MKLTHTKAVFVMVAVTLMWSIAGVITRHLEHARSFEITFWRSFFTVASLLVILPFFQGREVFARIRDGNRAAEVLTVAGADVRRIVLAIDRGGAEHLRAAGYDVEAVAVLRPTE